MIFAKRILEGVAVHSGLAGLARRRVARRTIVLAYHNVVDSRVGSRADQSLHISVRSFRAHLDVIERYCEVVPLAQLAGDAVARRPRVAITFDDAYRGALRLGLPELARRNLPATVFVPPAFVPDATFWWDDLARSGGLNERLRRSALEEGRGRDSEIRGLWGTKLAANPAPEDERCGSMEELQGVIRSGPVTLGSHTWSHPNLTRALPAELADELARPLSWLRQHFPDSFIRAVSYPYGLESLAVAAAARAAGYSLGFRVTGGWLPERLDDPLRLPRLNVPAGLSANGIALRLSGLLAA